MTCVEGVDSTAWKAIVTEAVLPSQSEPSPPNPRRVAAGRRNRALRRGLTDAGRERLRLSALRTQPWHFSSGPKSPAGKQQSVKNGKVRQQREMSVREQKASVAALVADLMMLRECRVQATRMLSEKTTSTPN